MPTPTPLPAGAEAPGPTTTMPDHPYQRQPDTAFWAQAVAEPAARSPAAVDPVVAPDFRIDRRARIATAGSCFAEHVARHLRAAGVRPFVTEPAHPLVPPPLARDAGYGVFTARYGNVYTARQLLQLMQRADGEFEPADEAWQRPDGRWIDPFRPRVQPGGFLSLDELRADRSRHFAAVRQMFAELDVLVFTLGLTEAWADRRDGAVFPVCPGVIAGTHDAGRHAALNFDVAEVTADLEHSVDRLMRINARAKLVLTVSPVPLVATAGDRHVLVASSYSKSVLRVAAEQVARRRAGVAYFPSYEIVTGPHQRGAYFEPDLRSVSEAGVAHAMRLFLEHYLGLALPATPEATAGPPTAQPSSDAAGGAGWVAQRGAVLQARCDEMLLQRPAPPG